MRKAPATRRLVFVEAERTASDFPLIADRIPDFISDGELDGVLGKEEIQKKIRYLKRLSVDDYIRYTVAPSEHPKRKNAAEIVRQLGGTIKNEVTDGPLYVAELTMEPNGKGRRVLVLAQNRKNKNGVWMPRHHREAAELIRFYSEYSMPVITFIDTPGADAGAEANAQNQAHSISELITEMSSMPTPTVGIVFGAGYSGGAIPLATTNIILSVRDGVFNTIHPIGLSEIAYNYDLSWQECAKYIGVSAYELCQAGYLDGVIDYSPLESDNAVPLRRAILSALARIEQNAMAFLQDEQNHYFFDHYRNNVLNFLNPTSLLVPEARDLDKSPTGRLNVFGSVYRFHRYLKLRRRLSSQSVLRYSRVFSRKLPAGELQKRMARERKERFNKWVRSPLEVRYDDALSKRYRRYLDTLKSVGEERGRISTFFRGRPEENFRKATEDMILELGLHLYNFWKVESRDNLVALLDYLAEQPEVDAPPAAEATILDLMALGPVRARFPETVKNLVLFDLLYDRLVDNLPLIAGELRGTNQISQTTMENLLERVFQEATGAYGSVFEGDLPQANATEFYRWVMGLLGDRDVEKLMRQISDWKRLAFPRHSEPLFGILAYFFSHLLPSYREAVDEGRRFEGKINPRNIGIKDFWERLNQAYRDLLIQNLLNSYKKAAIRPQDVLDRYFTDFEEVAGDLMTADPVRFPGFRQSIERALDNNIPAVGVITGLANFAHGDVKSKVGVVVSNTAFQAGAFDMASGEKVCKLMVECAVRKLPIVMFISSGGMQTKEGAGSLFSMAVLNDRINRFVKDFDLPVICFGYRDCTGGAQASFVTHRLVRTFYFSGAVIPFAGQRVVPSHLPAQVILSNYLSLTEGSMDGLVENPFDANLDDRLREIDPEIPVPQDTVEEALARILRGEYQPPEPTEAKEVLPSGYISFSPVSKVLIHARGATAARLVEGVHAAGADVVLVQSDADMESWPTKLLKDSDRLICLGGNTPSESYLNGMSVIRIAQQEGADAIHPGIGFLSENPNFAILCRRHGLNFIGPRAFSMELMGNKSNAIATARRLGVSTVPGSHGVVTDAAAAAALADEIGYPVLIKAAFGGGGKGMRVVHQRDAFREAFARTTQEAQSAFGNGDVYLEKFVETMRHVEIQILRDSHGNTKILGYRDCSVQRDNQKLIEESGSYKFPKKLLDDIYRYGEDLANDIDYVGAGTVEFIFDRKEQALYFMEMNTRLQVEHPVTEMCSGIDIVREQIRVASGESIKDLKVTNKGYAMEVRINAERISMDSEGTVSFVPSPGRVSKLRHPEMPNVRIVRAAAEGDEVPPYYDSLIMQVIAHGKSRAEVIKVLLAFLAETELEGPYTNIALMEALLADAVFREGDYDTQFLKGFYARTDLPAIIARSEARNRGAMTRIDSDAIRIENSEELKVLSPRTGVFYASAAPDDPPFVEVGDVFDINTTLCLMEAMKVFEDLSLADYNAMNGVSLFPSDHRFTLTRVMAETGQTVNQGNFLFVIKPVPLDAESSASS